MTDDLFLSWLYKQERSISREEINDKWPRAQFKKMIGITATFGEYKGEEVSLIPTRDWRMHYTGIQSEFEEITDMDER